MVNRFVRTYFPEYAELIDEGKCPFCGREIDPETEFRNEISRREYNISGLCQNCQDETFGVDPDTPLEEIAEFLKSGLDSEKTTILGQAVEDVDELL